MRRVGILTGGGDVPGLNTVIKTVATRCFAEGIEMWGIRRGWQGIVEVDPSDLKSRAEYILPLNAEVVRTIDRSGGTFLHSSRVNPAKMSEASLPAHLKGRKFPADDKGRLNATEAVLAHLAKLGIDALVVTGGDDTLGYANKLHAAGFNVVGVPKTMDNDVPGTEYCLGFSTAITRSVELIHALRVPTGSHERIAVVELFGRNSGATALYTAYLAATDRCLISEVPFDVDRLCEKLMADQDRNPSRYSICVVSEGAHAIEGEIVQRGEADPYGHRKLGGIGLWLGDEIKRRTGRGTIGQSLAYLMRSGAPDVLDRMVATNFGNLAFELLRDGRSGQMAAVRGGRYATVPLAELGKGAQPVDFRRFYDADEYRPRVHRPEGLPMFLG
jgi:6-phosphofructokinase 1